MRHAKSSWSDFSLTDHQRPLNARGRRDAPRMADWLKRNIGQVNLIISSDAQRTRETTQAMIDIQLSSRTPYWETSLYHGIPQKYLDCMYGLDEETRSIIMVGHNPTMTYIANEISDQFIDNVPTAGVIIGTFEGAWTEVNFDQIKFVKMMFPKNL